jgi:hypothetical protein
MTPTFTYTGTDILSTGNMSTFMDRYSEYPYWLELRGGFDYKLIHEWFKKQQIAASLGPDQEISLEELYDSKFMPKNSEKTFHNPGAALNGIFIYFKYEHARNKFLAHFSEDVVNTNPFKVSFSNNSEA